MWTLKTLSDLGTMERGRSRHRPRNDPRLFGGDMPFFQTGDVKAAALHLFRSSEFYSEFGVAQSRVWEPGTACITIAANIADTAILGCRGCFPDSIIGFTSTGHPLDAYFVKYLLDAFREELKTRARGTSQDNLSVEKLSTFAFPIPGSQTRVRIASVLKEFDQLIENNGRRVELLERMAEAIYREWFVHFRYPGHEAVPMVGSPLGPIPQDWRVAKLSELVSTQYGYTESACDSPIGPRFLRGKDINKTSYVNWSSVPYCAIGQAEHAKFRIDIGDVFVIRMADPGKVGICEVAVDAVFASYLVRMRPTDERLTRYFLFFTLQDDRYQSWVTGASSGSTRQSVSARAMTEPFICLPPKRLQEMFEAIVGPIRAHMNILIQQITVTASIRDLLLPKLVTGQIDVSQLDLDTLVGSAT